MTAATLTTRLALGGSLLALLLAGGCVSDHARSTGTGAGPLIGGDEAVLAATPLAETRRLRLVATNLVAALVQIPELQPAAATLQIRRPTTAFGNLVIRALEDAGFGLQLVTADQGRNNVSYRQRFATTESGPVDDFTLAVGRIELSREYVTTDDHIYPSSLMSIKGTGHVAAIELADDMFREQGDAGTAFISGTSTDDDEGDIRTIDVRGFDGLPPEERTASLRALAKARRHYFENEARRAAPDLTRFDRAERIVLLLDDADTLYLGRDNKRAVGRLLGNVAADDLLVIKACHDADGHDIAARAQAVRVEEEIVSYGIPPVAAWIAPCVRSNYQHAATKRSSPVEVVLYRPRP